MLIKLKRAVLAAPVIAARQLRLKAIKRAAKEFARYCDICNNSTNNNESF
jgi:hypothetical protein